MGDTALLQTFPVTGLQLCAALIAEQCIVRDGRTTLADELATVPATLPALMRAQKLQKRAAGHGLGQQDAAAAQHQLEAAVQSFAKAEEAAKQEAAGQLLFAAVNAARLAGVDAEEALTFASKRFAQQCLEQEQSGTQVE